jgi:hypothetical protein
MIFQSVAAAFPTTMQSATEDFRFLAKCTSTRNLSGGTPLDQRTHNPLVQGSNPCGPTNAHLSLLCVSEQRHRSQTRVGKGLEVLGGGGSRLAQGSSLLNAVHTTSGALVTRL